MEGGNAYSDYMASLSTSCIWVIWVSVTQLSMVMGAGVDVESDQIIFSIGKSF